MSEPRQRRRSVKLFYYGGGFFTKNLHKEWMPIKDGVALQYLMRGGFRGVAGRDERLSPAHSHLLTVRERDFVHYAGDVAGQRTGLLCYNGRRVLVTSQARLPIASKGSFPCWDEILTTHYGDHLPYVLEWHRQAYLRLAKNGGPMLPALALSGAAGTGKTLTGNVLTRHLLGGRLANPVRYMTGQTSFNADVTASETLLLDDIPGRMHQDKLENFQGLLKTMIASPFTSLHPKGKDAFDVPAVQAIMLAINMEAHNFRVLPLDDTDLDDKLMLIRVRARPALLPYDGEAQAALEKKLVKEIPHLLWHLLNDFRMPAALRWQRGQPCFRDPDLLGKAQENDGVARVLWLFDKVKRLPSIGKTAHEWDEVLRSELGALAASILDNGRHPLSMGHILKHAARRHPERVSKEDGEAHGGVTRWKIAASVRS